MLLLSAAASFAAEMKPLVVTSFLPLYCWAVNVAGDHARVESLLPPQAEPHDYAFTPGDARKLNAANLVIVNGMGLEPWLTKWTRSVPHAEQKLIVISATLDASQRIDANPHFWMDPRLACIAVSNIASALSRADPEHALSYTSNAVTYVRALQRLDADIRAALEGVTNRAIVTYHDAFPYFAHRYGLEIVGVVEQIPDVNPAPKYLAHLSRTIRARGVRAIFIAPNSASRLARQIAKDLRVELVELDTIEAGALTPEAYERAMRANLDALRRTLR
jgi:ABC-type Zn uptake system ZnuABC Zn-binding protein ZnuA